MLDLSKVATVLELTAEYVDQNEQAKEAASAETRRTRIGAIATAHLAAHGEELPETTRGKLARADESSLEVIEELLSKQAGAASAPDALGAGADHENPVASTKKEAADAAWDAFGSWITSK